jgi:condensation enzyme
MIDASRAEEAITWQFPLSTQQRLWSADHHTGAFDPQFTIAIALRITGEVDIDALQAALDDVVARHEILRTKIAFHASPPYQQVYPPSPVPLLVREMPVKAGQRREERAEGLLREAKRSPLAIEALPLLRANLTKLGAFDSVLALVTHHTVGDGWSLQLIARDLAEFYAARTASREPKLPPLRQYGEYAIWEQENTVSQKSRTADEYWKGKLKDAQIFALPVDRPNPQGKRYIAHRSVIGVDVMAAASALSRDMRATNFMVLLAAFNVLASQINRTTDPVINTISAGRNDRQFHNTIGSFLNFIPLRTEIGGCTRFREVLALTRATCLESYRHEIPVQRIEKSAPRIMAPARGHTMCDFILGYFRSQFDSAALRIADGSEEIIDPKPTSAQLPGGVSWTLAPLRSEEVSSTIEFNLEEFDETTIRGWSQRYFRILAGAVAEPDRPWRNVAD